MFRRILFVGGTLLAAAALVFLTPAPGQAAPRGGFRPGGFSAGGFRAGGFRAGGFYAGGFRAGGFHYAGYRYGGLHYHPYHWGHYRPYYGGSYSYYPYSYDSYPYYGYSSGYSGGSSAYNPGYSSLYYQSVPSYYDGAMSGGWAPGGYQATGAPAIPAPAGDVARLTVTVPADARVWIDDVLRTPTGSVREFCSPPLDPGSRYTYTIRARWDDNGCEVTQKQQVVLTPGAHLVVRFPVPPGAPGGARP
jgi:uncharacterized protein (TIGR03000 family)